MKYRRILLKLSGELFAGPGPGLVDFSETEKVAREILQVKKTGVQIGVVIGAGNIYRGRNVKGKTVDVKYAHYMGMMGTVINSLALYAVFQQLRCKCVVLSEFPVKTLTESISPARAKKYLKKGHVVIFAGGTGKPGVTTDTAAVLRAKQIKADAVFKATNVLGVYDKDPDKFKSAKMYKTLSCKEAIDKKLKVMDTEAFKLAQKNKIPILVFKWQKGNLGKIFKGKKIGTLVS